MGLSSSILGSRARYNLPFEFSIESFSESDKYTRRQDLVRVIKFNEDVMAWAKNTKAKLKMNIKSLVSQDRSLSRSLGYRVYYDRKYAKEAQRIGFSFDREGVYLHKGARRGYGGTKGSKWYTLKGEVRTTNPNSLFKMGTGNSPEIEWFNPIIEYEAPQLADLVSEYWVTLTVDKTKMLIR